MPDSRPNVLIILSDDLGWFDVGCYHQGIMGSRTPNIDRIAAEAKGIGNT
jgi:arylsulfatase A-like enzyme